jgi:hypothetical protein
MHIHLAPLRDMRLLLAAGAFYVNIITTAAFLIASLYLQRIPYHNPALTGQAWLDVLLNWHPDRIKNKFEYLNMSSWHLYIFCD